MNNEFWKNIPDFIDYQVSNLGRIRKFDDILKFSINGQGYYTVSLKQQGKAIRKLVHRIVAKIWVPDFFCELLIVNHKDGNKLNNYADNLEWVTVSENVKHAHKNGLINYSKKAVTQYSFKGIKIKDYNSIKEASEMTNIWKSQISSCVKNKTHFNAAGGFIWKYKEN